MTQSIQACIYDFIPSPDVADYCRRLGATFNAIEMAVIVHLSCWPLVKKLEAWREIIASCDDMPVKEDRIYWGLSSEDWRRAKSIYKVDDPHSFLSCLAQVVRGCERTMEYCLESGPEVVFICDTWGDFRGTCVCVSTIDGLFEVEGVELRNFNGRYETRIRKCKFNGGPTVHFTLSSRKEILELRDYEKILSPEERWTCCYLEGFYIEVPMPFRCGDIVQRIPRAYGDSEDVLVFGEDRYDLPYWPVERHPHFDGSDVEMICYDNNGWHRHENYLYLRYYRGAGKVDRLKTIRANQNLPALSDFLKGKMTWGDFVEGEVKRLRSDLLRNMHTSERWAPGIPPIQS